MCQATDETPWAQKFRPQWRLEVCVSDVDERKNSVLTWILQFELAFQKKEGM